VVSDTGFGEWREMASAPKDGSRILVEIRASEQGPAEVDLVRWGKPDRSQEPCWISADSDPGALIIYPETEVTGWMPLPSPLPRLRAAAGAKDRSAASEGPAEDEIGGSGI
jgi:hypothetical protein